MTESKGNRTNKALMILVALLLISNVALIFKLMSTDKTVENQVQQIDELSSEKEDVTNMLQNMLTQYDELEVSNDTLKAEISAQKAQIEELLVQVEKNKDLSWLLHKARKEANTLRDIMKGYVVTIDSLNHLNQELQAENMTITQELGEVKGQKEALQTMTSELEGRLEQGSILHTLSMGAEAVYLRSNGKQVSTSRARKAEMIKCCFNVGANRTTEPGNRVMHMRVISPDGSVLPSSEANARFEFNGVQGDYSAKRSIDYQNESMDVCIFYTTAGELATGAYLVEIYDRGELIDKASFDLK
jgi:flagellar basal body-associated protein FliL